MGRLLQTLSMLQTHVNTQSHTLTLSLPTHTYLTKGPTHVKLHVQLCLAISVSELSHVFAKRLAYLIWTDSQVMEDEHFLPLAC